MPTYEYECQKCKHCFEKICKIDDREFPTKNPCPNCLEKDCVTICIGAAGLVRPSAVTGLQKPATPFKERMQQIKHGLPSKYKKNMRDY